MAAVVEKTLRKRIKNSAHSLQYFLEARNVSSVDLVRDLDCDGLIEPVGSDFRDGFRIQLKRDVSDRRTRFTLAHEACHTFFYQFVPEIKFTAHNTDDSEERLCNFGAAALLIPSTSLRAKSTRVSPCLKGLEQLANEYWVSIPTMLMRLKALGLWRCELAHWHRTLSGQFVLERIYGARHADWKWDDPKVLEQVWESNESVFGNAFLYLEDGSDRRYKPIVYNARRFAGGVSVLCGNNISEAKPAESMLPIQRTFEDDCCIEFALLTPKITNFHQTTPILNY